jgi:glutathione S-transferase
MQGVLKLDMHVAQFTMLHLTASASIMKYLVQKYEVPDHWFPADPQRRAKINEYLDWHHQNLRVGAAHTIFHTVTC